MPLHLYISLGILSSWLVFGSILCWMVYIYDMSFDFIVVKGSKRIKYAIYMLFCLCFSYYVFCIRINRVGKSLDIPDLFNILKDFLFKSELKDIFIVVFVIVLLIIFWILLLRCIYQHLKKCILALYLYYNQYETFRDKCFEIAGIDHYYDGYLFRRVLIFTENHSILKISRIIWPISTSILERNLFHFLIPYLIIFDLLTKSGQISKIFVILPWFYVYTLIRSFFVLFFQMDILENWELSQKLYGFKKEFKW